MVCLWHFMVIEWDLPCGKRLHNHGKTSLLAGNSSISMALFNSYVKFLEGMLFGKHHQLCLSESHLVPA